MARQITGSTWFMNYSQHKLNAIAITNLKLLLADESRVQGATWKDDMHQPWISYKALFHKKANFKQEHSR